MSYATNVLPCAVVAATLVLGGCAVARGPVIDTGEQPTGVGGTISGIVRGVGDTPLSGRKVTAVNLDTAARVETSTAANGGYTLKVVPGHYRVEVELRPDEAVIDPPDEVHISKGDLDAGRNFVITAKR